MKNKKIISAILAFSLTLSAMASSYLNFTIPLSTGFHSQNDVESDYYSSNEESGKTIGLNAEYLRSVDESSFVFGGLLGFHSGEMSVNYDKTYFDTKYENITLKFAPAIGWAFGDTTKKKINIYPLAYTHSFLFDGYLKDSTSIDAKNASVDSLGIDFDFSFQWGQNKIQNGFAFGFGWDWLSIFKLDGTKIGRKDGTFSGFNIRIGYKLSFDMSKNSSKNMSEIEY